MADRSACATGESRSSSTAMSCRASAIFACHVSIAGGPSAGGIMAISSSSNIASRTCSIAISTRTSDSTCCRRVLTDIEMLMHQALNARASASAIAVSSRDPVVPRDTRIIAGRPQQAAAPSSFPESF